MNKLILKALHITVIIYIFTFEVLAQQYKDYIGAGHNIGVTITASSQSNGTNAVFAE